MKTYSEFQALANTRKRKLANHTYLLTRDDGGFAVKLHATEVVIHYPDHIVLNSGGWQTRTTANRMNEFSPVRVHSEKGIWYANDLPYADGITFWADGHVTGQGDDPHATLHLRRAVNQYAKDYAVALDSGLMHEPSAGDCLYCSLFPGEHAGHIHAHLEEKYYVPSILNHCRERLSPIACDYVARKFAGEDYTYSFADLCREQVQKAVRWYCLHQLGLAA